jgi:flagellar biosynthetic protein FlhB
MGLLNDKDDKTEPATPKRMSEARNKGQVAKSPELGMATLMLVGILLVQAGGSSLIDSLKAGLVGGFKLELVHDTSEAWAIQTLRGAIFRVLPAILVFSAVLVATALVAGFGQVGLKFTTEPIRPKLEKLNPMKGISRLFSLRSLMTTGLALLKFVVLFGILWLNISSDIPLLLKLAELPFSEAAPIVSQLAIKILWWIALVLLLLAIIDVVYQKWQHKRDMRMSKQDIKGRDQEQRWRP